MSQQTMVPSAEVSDQRSVSPLIDWKSAFDTGLDVIDQEHRALAGLMNQLHAAMHRGDSQSAVAALLEGVAEHISIHFAHEEQIMERVQYPHRNEHWNEHVELLADIADVMDEYEAGRYCDCPGALDHYLKFWLLTHIMTEDVRLAAFVINCQHDGIDV